MFPERAPGFFQLFWGREKKQIKILGANSHFKINNTTHRKMTQAAEIVDGSNVNDHLNVLLKWFIIMNETEDSFNTPPMTDLDDDDDFSLSLSSLFDDDDDDDDDDDIGNTPPNDEGLMDSIPKCGVVEVTRAGVRFVHK